MGFHRLYADPWRGSAFIWLDRSGPVQVLEADTGTGPGLLSAVPFVPCYACFCCEQPLCPEQVASALEEESPQAPRRTLTEEIIEDTRETLRSPRFARRVCPL